MGRKRSTPAQKPSAQPTGKRDRHKPEPPPAPAWWRTPRGIVGIAIVALVGIGAAFFAVRAAQPQEPIFYQQGSVSNCNTVQPQFSIELGFSRNAIFDTRTNFVNGIALYEVDGQGNIIRSHQDPSWISGGSLGRPVLDGNSNVFVVPVPAINTWTNPIERANTIYRIDAETGVMAAYIDLPTAAPPNADNPYGLLGLGYDCETNSLYATSVYGSNRTTQAGRIYHINLTTGEVQSQFDNVDAFGIAVFNAAHGKRLYFGLAREPRVLSVSLDLQGNISGDLREEFSLDDFGINTDQRVRSIRFLGIDRMQLRTVQFSFNLVAPTEVRESLLEYVYDPNSDSWRLDASNLSNLGL